MFFKKKSENTNIPNKFYQISEHQLDEKELIPLFWWDESKNFGDWIGPYLVSKLTSKAVFNTKQFPVINNNFFTVGSILEHLPTNSNNLHIWGSGLIQPISNSKNLLKTLKTLKNLNIHAVRGEHTHHELSQHLKVSIPQVYGDPAILMPEFYIPSSLQKQYKISICPHTTQRELFNNLDKDFHIIDVEQDIIEVIDEICQSEVCISASLHGLIIAQAYNIPWVWIDISDKKLYGHHFKFYDFFSTLNISNPISPYTFSSLDIPKVNFKTVAKLAKCYNFKHNPKSLLNSFPFFKREH